MQAALFFFEPSTEGQKALHSETLQAFNELVANRRLRLDAVDSALSGIMWFVIWVGAAISISVAYFFHIEDAKLHAIMIGLLAAFLGIVLFVIIANDRPFVGDTGIRPTSYQLILDTVIDLPGYQYTR